MAILKSPTQSELASYYEDHMNARIALMGIELAHWITKLVEVCATKLHQIDGENVIPIRPNHYEFQVCKMFETLNDFFDHGMSHFDVDSLDSAHEEFNQIYERHSESVLEQTIEKFGLSLTPEELMEKILPLAGEHKKFFWHAHLKMPILQLYRHGLILRA